MNKCFIISTFAAFISISAVECYAQNRYNQFCDSVLKCNLSVAETIIDGSVHSYYKQYYRLPKNYDDLLQFFTKDDREYLVTLCDSLFYKNRSLITFIQNPDSSALLYSGEIVFGLFSQHTCKIILESPVSIGFHMVDTGGCSFYDDSVVFIIKKLILPTVYKMAQETSCNKRFMILDSNTIPCNIPYQYDVRNKSLSIVEDCRKLDIKTCHEFDSALESELKKYDFEGIKLITFPVHLYFEKSINETLGGGNGPVPVTTEQQNNSSQ